MDPRSAAGLLVLPDLPNPLSQVQIAEIPPLPTGQTAITPAMLSAANAGGTGPGRPGGDRAGDPGGKGKGKGKRGGFSPTAIVDQALSENDADKDGKISLAEMSTMDDRRKQMLDGADKDGDGFMNKSELLVAANGFMQRMREARAAGGGPGGRGGPGGGGAGAGE
jgi:hypothetical protein